MGIISKLDVFLLSESAIRLTPYGASFIKHQDVFSKDDMDRIISKMESNAGKDMKYEITFGKSADRNKLIIYRKDLTKADMSDDDMKIFNNEIKDLIKGTDLNMAGDTRVTKWAAMFLTK